MSKLAAMATATTVAKGFSKDILFFNAWWRGDPAVAAAVATNSDTTLYNHWILPVWSRCCPPAPDRRPSSEPPQVDPWLAPADCWRLLSSTWCSSSAKIAASIPPVDHGLCVQSPRLASGCAAHDGILNKTVMELTFDFNPDRQVMSTVICRVLYEQRSD